MTVVALLSGYDAESWLFLPARRCAEVYTRPGETYWNRPDESSLFHRAPLQYTHRTALFLTRWLAI
jgi:hypothetical protein